MGLDLHHLTPTQNAEHNVWDFLSVDDLDKSPSYIIRNEKFLVVVSHDEHDIETGMYFESKGHQRKGVHEQFYKNFENDGVYFDLQYVIKAYDYLYADDYSRLLDLRQNFQKNFMENFVEGESIFAVSW